MGSPIKAKRLKLGQGRLPHPLVPKASLAIAVDVLNTELTPSDDWDHSGTNPYGFVEIGSNSIG